VLGMKLIVSVCGPLRCREIAPEPYGQCKPPPPFQANSRRLPSNRWRLFHNRRALRLHGSERCRPIMRQCGLLRACDKKMAHRPTKYARGVVYTATLRSACR